jgi:hypothetical protein
MFSYPTLSANGERRLHARASASSASLVRDFTFWSRRLPDNMIYQPRSLSFVLVACRLFDVDTVPSDHCGAAAT